MVLYLNDGLACRRLGLLYYIHSWLVCLSVWNVS